MNADMPKAMLMAWINASLVPALKDKAQAAVIAVDIVGLLVGAAVGVAKRVGWTQEDLVRVVRTVWETSSSPPQD